VKIDSVLVVCVGNICRSPVGERVLLHMLEQINSKIAISSAGIAALEGYPADEIATAVAKASGVSLDGHVARQFTRELGTNHDLVLVMEPGHKREIIKTAPDLSGRILLFDQWTNAKGIADPYRRSRTFHEEVFVQIETAATSWAEKLQK
jgi:protein-tyrosine phosphatase